MPGSGRGDEAGVLFCLAGGGICGQIQFGKAIEERLAASLLEVANYLNALDVVESVSYALTLCENV